MISEYLNNWELWPFLYGFRFKLAKPGDVGDAILGAAMSLQGDSDFIARALSIDLQINGTSINEFSGSAPMASYLSGSSSYASYTRKLYLPDSRAVQTLHQIQAEIQPFDTASDPLPGMLSGASNQCGFVGVNHCEDGDATRPLPIIPEILLSRSSSLMIDLQNLTEAHVFLGGKPLVLEICFRGSKLFRKGTHYRIDPSKRYKALPFTYYATVPALSSSAAGQLVPQNIVNLDAGSAFMLLSVDTPGWHSGFQVQIYGPEGERTSYSNSTVVQGLLSRGNALGTSRFPGVVCPPIHYPRSGRILWDYYLPANVSQPNTQGAPLLLKFKGIKLYEV